MKKFFKKTGGAGLFHSRNMIIRTIYMVHIAVGQVWVSNGTSGTVS